MNKKGIKVLLLKPLVDDRDILDGKIIVKSRIGLYSSCETFSFDDNLYNKVTDEGYANSDCVVIVDECQFCTREQVEQLKALTKFVPVLCYGLMVNFKTELFEDSKRLVEISDSLMEIKSVCRCGRKATVNARFINGEFQLEGKEIVIGGNEEYEGICYNCYEK